MFHKQHLIIYVCLCVFVRLVDERKATHDAALDLGKNFGDSMYSLVVRANFMKYDLTIGKTQRRVQSVPGGTRGMGMDGFD